MGIKRRVGIMESGRTKTPMVTGHLKPLILIPISMFTSLSVEEAEAILLHELAHIRRADYLVNLLQNLMEIIFFFNPAVLWLSSLIKAERENCCDDMALVRSSKVIYLKALVACEAYNQPPAAYAMALNGGKGGLKKRVARIISNKNLTLNSREKSLLAAILIATGVLTGAFSATQKTDRTQSIISDMLQDGIIASANDLSFKIGKDEFVVDYKKQPEAVYQKYRAKYVGEQPDGDLTWYYHFDTDKYNNKTNAAAPTDAERTKNIISDLMQDGIITGPNGLSFKIGTDEFVVNYKKQPDAVYQKYRAKYVAGQPHGHDDWIWYYRFDENTDHSPADDVTTGVFQGKLN